MLLFACQAFATSDDVWAEPNICPLERALHEELMDETLDQASDMLFLLTGGRIHGVCTATVYPVAEDWCAVSNVGSTGHLGYLAGVKLRGPFAAVTAVKIDGDTLDPSAYVLVNGDTLVRVVGDWPSNNSGPVIADTEVGSWSITHTFGFVDFLTKRAAIEMAVELAKQSLGQSSALPPGVVSASIQGVSVSIEDDDRLRAAGEALPALSRFLGIHAPLGQAVSTVWSPELEQGYRLYSR